MKAGIKNTAAFPSVDVPRLVLHLRSVLEYAERETCTHEETHRGGVIWEICNSCGKKWADDEGCKPDDAHDLPQVLRDARDFLNSLEQLELPTGNTIEAEESTGRAIAEAIGESLRASGVFDSLVGRGKDPDSTAVYIYNHHHVWLKDAPLFESCRTVAVGERRVHKLRRGEREVGYEFEFTDEPGVVYCTNYGWSLVPDTPEHVRALEYYHNAQRQIIVWQAELRDLLNRISLGNTEE